MLDHIDFGVTDLAASSRFFAAALAPLGITVSTQGTHGTGLGTNGRPCVFLAPVNGTPTRLHIAFAARTRAEVHAFYEAALLAGGKDNGPPGLRPHYHPNYYAAFVIAPDGHNVEAVFHGAARRRSKRAP